MTAPRYAILLHREPCGDHWDLLLEQDEALATWRLLRNPLGPSGPIPAERLPDHRKLYLTYEGPISGDRGQVTRVDEGTYALLAADPRCWRVRLAGTVLAGDFTLQADDDEGRRWTFAPVRPGAE